MKHRGRFAECVGRDLGEIHDHYVVRKRAKDYQIVIMLGSLTIDIPVGLDKP